MTRAEQLLELLQSEAPLADTYRLLKQSYAAFGVMVTEDNGRDFQFTVDQTAKLVCVCCEALKYYKRLTFSTITKFFAAGVHDCINYLKSVGARPSEELLSSPPAFALAANYHPDYLRQHVEHISRAACLLRLCEVDTMTGTSWEQRKNLLRFLVENPKANLRYDCVGAAVRYFLAHKNLRLRFVLGGTDSLVGHVWLEQDGKWIEPKVGVQFSQILPYTKILVLDPEDSWQFKNVSTAESVAHWQHSSAIEGNVLAI